MEKLTIQSLNALFTYLNDQVASVLWIRSKDNKRQLYVSTNYESIWGRPVNHLYEAPESFIDTLVDTNDTDTINSIHSRYDAIKSKNTDGSLLYCIVTPNGHKRFIKDQAYSLVDTNNEVIGITGVAHLITEQEWFAEKSRRIANDTNSDPKQILKNYVLQILNNELRVIASGMRQEAKPGNSLLVMSNGRSVDLTTREIECLSLLLSGNSAKQTAALLGISTRTVEFHLRNIREKAECRSSIELIGKTKLINNNT